MTNDEIMERLNRIREITAESESVGEISLMLTDLSQAIAETISERDNLRNRVTTQENEINGLRDYNMRLFLKVGEKPQFESAPASEPEPEEKPMNFEDLINEKGEIVNG